MDAPVVTTRLSLYTKSALYIGDAVAIDLAVRHARITPDAAAGNVFRPAAIRIEIRDYIVMGDVGVLAVGAFAVAAVEFYSLPFRNHIPSAKRHRIAQETRYRIAVNLGVVACIHHNAHTADVFHDVVADNNAVGLSVVADLYAIFIFFPAWLGHVPVLDGVARDNHSCEPAFPVSHRQSHVCVDPASP